MSGSIHMIGIGPGALDWLAPGAQKVLATADIILGYHKYLRQIETLLPDIPREGSGMRHEVERAKRAIELATQGRNVSMVSGGDAGIYGMAGLVLGILENQGNQTIPVEVLPGITALTAAAALLGAPLMTDFAVISLSDYLTPLETIMTRLSAAIQGNFVICLYNPRSRQRTDPFDRAYTLLMNTLGEDRPVGIVRAGFRDDQQVICTTLKNIPAHEIGMDCILIIGNNDTHFWNDKMITPRGYQISVAEEKLM
jgi:precorrin-3B C17-methyltransferase